jgi:DnaJ-class molecular chaperone
MKDYYEILGVTSTSGDDEIRKNYRQLAMQHHPDRNPDDPAAEEKFKEIAEAYGVLTDPLKRRQYDGFKASGGKQYQDSSEGGFNYSQEDILRDLFQDPHFQQVFQGLLREFQRSGFRANPQFIKQSFFGGKGGMFFGGLFLFGSLAGPALVRSAKKSLPEKRSLLKNVGNAVGALLGGSKQNPVEKPLPSQPSSENDVLYVTQLKPDELQQGKIVQVVSQGPDGQEMLRVTIPAGSRAGQKLRLRGKGKKGPNGRGDLYLQLEEK